VVSYGLRLVRLVVSGEGKQDADVTFTPGLNVITGPSDTGKTYIFDTIDYVLGASAPPKNIDEARGYDVARLTIATSAGEAHVLERSLRGGDVLATAPSGATRPLKAKHAADDPNTVSSFLLGLAGLSGRRIRKNEGGATRSVSFRDLARLALVNEVDVMAARSPALSGQVIHKTVESRFLRLLLTGEDDASVIALEDSKKASARRAGRTEVLEDLLARVQTRREARGEPVRDLEVIDRELTQAADVASESKTTLTEQQGAAAQLEQQRRTAWAALRQAESRADVLQELQVRFGLLEQQYASDLSRLAAIAEAGLRLDQMTEERCPVCGALAADQHHDHADARPSPADIRASCEAEAAKITTLMADLRSTVESNDAELATLVKTRDSHRAELKDIGVALDEALRPRLAAAAERFQNAEAQRRRLEQERDLVVREQELRELIDQGTRGRQPRAKVVPTATGASDADEFTKAVEKLLHDWHFPEADRVTFSETEQDLVISGRPRASHGKGVRAITHAAFVLALLRHTADTGKPSAGFVMIDSPLVVYREPDADEDGFSSAVKEYFYKSLVSSFRDVQVIILENDPPPADVATDANVISFTKSSTGRYGFFPVA
jgi:AAA domain-containing protein